MIITVCWTFSMLSTKEIVEQQNSSDDHRNKPFSYEIKCSIFIALTI